MSSRSVTTVLSTAVLMALGGSLWAVPPSPEAKKKFIAEGTWEQKGANLRAFEEAQNADKYERARSFDPYRSRASSALGTEAVDTIRVCVLLVEFPDFKHDDDSYPIPGGGILNCPAVGTPAMFDSMLFSVRGQDAVYNPTGSMTDFYMENSYGTYFIQGDVHGWFTVPQDYSYYVGDNDGLGLGGLLAHDAAIAADDAGVDFSPYGNGSSIVEGIIIIHAGPGAEQGAYGIWSHQGSMSPGVSRDGVHLGEYAMQPEERFNENSIVHVGVFCHEWGHVLNVPDWYDVAYNPGSEGLGSWSLMAGGSWNDNGRLPAHFDGYSKFLCGFNNLQLLTQNIRHAPIPQAETSPICYLLKDSPVAGTGSIEMWFVENRQRVGFDQALPGDGLMIYHFDPVGHQYTPDRYMLALEEADGRRDMAFDGSNGQNSDPFPGYGVNNRYFHDYTTPNSKTNDSAFSEVSVLNITGSDSMMYADLGVYYALPWPVLTGDSLTISDAAPGGDGDGMYEQGETLSIHLEVRNLMKITYYPTLHLDLDNPDLEILDNDQWMGTALNPIVNNTNNSPIRVMIPDDFMSAVVNFKLTVVSDSSFTSHDRIFENPFEFDIAVGRPQILLVDDDNNRGDEYAYTSALNRLGLPFVLWNKYASGSPTYAAVSQYPNVLWMTGAYYPPLYLGGTLTAADVTFMKELLNNGGNLLLASYTAPAGLNVLDSAFMADYLHANLTGSTNIGSRIYAGDSSHVVSGGLWYQPRNEAAWNKVTPTLAPANGGQAVFTITSSGSGNYGTSGVVYDGVYRTAFFSFAVELLADNYAGIAPKDSLIMRTMRFFARGSATGVDDEPYDNLLPDQFALEQNYPNPFNPGTTIIYHIAPGDPVRTNLAIFNVLGQKVATLVDEVQGPGSYTVSWEGMDEQGSQVASGVYFYRLVHGDKIDARKMMLLK